MHITASLLAMASTVSAHALMYGVWVNGVDQGDGRNEYIRTPPNNNPVKDLSSPDMACNVNGGTAAPSFVSAAAGDTLSFEWLHNTRNDDIIDGSHSGPIITYIAEYTEGDGTGPIWTKIAEDGYDGTQWAVDKLKANSGLNDFVVPEDLAAGQYLIRQEIIAHHESEVSFADNPARGAQFYPSCVQVEVTSGGSAVPNQGFDVNVDYTYEDPGIVFNLYSSFTTYPIPGPEVWAGEGGSAPGPVPTATASASVTASPSVTSTPTPTASSGGSPGETAAPEPSISTIVPDVPTTTSAPSTAEPTPTSSPSQPPTGCRRKRSNKNKRNKNKRSTTKKDKLARRVGRAQL